MDQVKKAAAEYNAIAAVTAKAGLQQGLHNEGFEASMVDGKRTYDLLFDLLDPKLVKFQFQMSEIANGLIAADYFTKYPGRFFSMHIQDVDLKATRRGQGRGGRPCRRAGAGGGRQGGHRLGENVRRGADWRGQELLRRAEHGADAGERRGTEGDEGVGAAA